MIEGFSFKPRTVAIFFAAAMQTALMLIPVWRNPDLGKGVEYYEMGLLYAGIVIRGVLDMPSNFHWHTVPMLLCCRLSGLDTQLQNGRYQSLLVGTTALQRPRKFYLKSGYRYESMSSLRLKPFATLSSVW